MNRGIGRGIALLLATTLPAAPAMAWTFDLTTEERVAWSGTTVPESDWSGVETVWGHRITPLLSVGTPGSGGLPGGGGGLEVSFSDSGLWPSLDLPDVMVDATTFVKATRDSTYEVFAHAGPHSPVSAALSSDNTYSVLFPSGRVHKLARVVDLDGIRMAEGRAGYDGSYKAENLSFSGRFSLRSQANALSGASGVASGEAWASTSGTYIVDRTTTASLMLDFRILDNSPDAAFRVVNVETGEAVWEADAAGLGIDSQGERVRLVYEGSITPGTYRVEATATTFSSAKSNDHPAAAEQLRIDWSLDLDKARLTADEYLLRLAEAIQPELWATTDDPGPERFLYKSDGTSALTTDPSLRLKVPDRDVIAIDRLVTSREEALGLVMADLYGADWQNAVGAETYATLFAVPEPASLLLLSAGALGMLSRRRIPQFR